MQQHSRPLAISMPRAGAAILAVAVGLMWGTLPARAQFNIASVTHPGGLMVLQAQNPLTISYVTGTTTPVTYYWQVPGGRFGLLTGPTPPTGGDPTQAGEENRYVASVLTATTGPDDYPYSYFTSKLTVAVDDVYYDLHVLGAAADSVTGTNPVWDYWPVPMTTGSRDVYGVGRIPLDDDDPNVATEFLEVTHHFTLIHDAVRIEYIVTNKTTRTLAVGIRQLIDGRFGGTSQLDGRSVVLPSGRVISSEAKLPDAETSVVPDTWLMYDNPDDPTLSVRGTLDAEEVYDPGTANQSAGKPDEIDFGLMRSLGADLQWDFTPNQAQALDGEDWAYVAKWEQKELTPGRSRRYVTYFGLGNATVDYDPPYALAGYTPNMLYATAGDDPSTPTVTEDYYLTDRNGNSPFPVYAYADNFYASPLLDATVRISLPTGLELDPETQPRSRSMGTVRRNELKSVSWTVRATGARPGVAVIKFTGPQGKTVERKIYIPAVPILTPLPSLNGLEMISIPYTFSNTDAEHVFQDLGYLHVGGPNALIRYNPTAEDYAFFPDPFVTNITPGLGYWLLNRNRLTVHLPDDAVALPTDEAYAVTVNRGWNQIGNPFAGPSYWDKTRVIGPTGMEWSLEEALDRGLLLATLFWYNSETGEYEWETDLAQTRLDPYYGYWLYCREDLTLLFSPPSLLAPAGARPVGAATAATRDEGWKVALTVSGAGRVRDNRYFGMSPGAQDGLDKQDVMAPPTALRNGVMLSAELMKPGQSTRYMQDIRQTRPGPHEWVLVVNTDASGQPITVSWPDLSQLPNDLSATLEDLATGEKRYMRTTSGYTFVTPDGGCERRLKITVQPRGAKTALVTAAAVQPAAGGASVTYTLTGDAAVDIQVRNIAGVPIKTLASGRLGTAGVNTLLWDGRSERGVRVPAGRYLCQITARSPETGEQHCLVRSFQVGR